MAQVWPKLEEVTSQHGGLHRERDVIERLELGLPDTYYVVHSVGWQSVRDGSDYYGEIDVLVIAPTGSVLLLEVKAGQLVHENGQLIKRYGTGARDVIRQMHTQYAATRARLQQAGLDTYLAVALVVPDHVLGDQAVLGVEPDRIIDATRFDQLATVVRGILDGHPGASDVQRIHRFFLNQFDLQIDLRIMGEQVRTAARRMADGLATWVPRFHSAEGLYRIQATAGSGKTQLALRLLEEHRVGGLPALYVSFNRTLADHVARLVSPAVQVSNFHELCVDHYRRTHGEPDFSDPGLFPQIEKVYYQAAQTDPRMQDRYGLMVVDEAQDFQPEWVQCLLEQLHPSGRFYILEDDSQRLYDREAFDLPGQVVVVSNDNYRTPRAICDVINALRLTPEPVNPRSPWAGELPAFHVFQNASSGQVRRLTESAVDSLVSKGIALSDIVVLSWHGLKSSAVLANQRLGRYDLKRFTGAFDSSGSPVWTTGELMSESVYRFKGQSAAGVVLTEVDFEEVDDKVRRKLFVAMTRAHIAMEIVLSEKAEQCLAALLEPSAS